MPKPDEGWSPIIKLNQETCLQEKVDFYGQKAEDFVWVRKISDAQNCQTRKKGIT